MEERSEHLRQGLRYDPQKRRRAQRHGKRKAIRIEITAAELRKAGIDPDGPAPEYRVWGTAKGRGGVFVRLYKIAQHEP